MLLAKFAKLDACKKLVFYSMNHDQDVYLGEFTAGVSQHMNLHERHTYTHHISSRADSSQNKTSYDHHDTI